MCDLQLNPTLTTLLRGKYNRTSIREALEGLTVADISGCSYDFFMRTIADKDQIVANRFWIEVLMPVQQAWHTYNRHPIRAIEADRQNLLRAIARVTGDENQNPPNNQSIQR